MNILDMRQTMVCVNACWVAFLRARACWNQILWRWVVFFPLALGIPLGTYCDGSYFGFLLGDKILLRRALY